jgi:phage gp29-like protein
VEELNWVPQKKLTFVEDLAPRLLTADGPWQGVPFPPWKVIYHRYKAKSGYDTRAGVLRVVGYMYLLKNYSLKDWAGFNEVFGMPLRLGKYDPASTPSDREALIQAVRNLGSDAAGIISKNTEIEFVEASNRLSGNANPFQVLADFCNREMSKAILGQTLTTDTSGETGTYSAAKVHAQVRSDLVVADAQSLGQTLREQLLRPLVGFNFGWDKPIPWFRFRFEESEDLLTLSEVYRNLVNMGVPLSLEHVAERFGIPLAKEGQAIVGQAKNR